jgi:hypothetical protein
LSKSWSGDEQKGKKLDDSSTPIIDDDSYKLISEIRNFIMFECRTMCKAMTQEILDEFGPRKKLTTMDNICWTNEWRTPSDTTSYGIFNLHACMKKINVKLTFSHFHFKLKSGHYY